MNDKPTCSRHRVALYRPPGATTSRCMHPGCTESAEADTGSHAEGDALAYARSTADHDPRVGVDGDAYDTDLEEH